MLATAVKACTLETGKALHCHAHESGPVSDDYDRAALIDIYERGCDIVLARGLFDSMV